MGKKQLAEQFPTKSFQKILLEVIDETLLNLGETVKTSIYFHLKNSFNIKRQDIPHKIEDFSEALEQMFGVGAKYLEISFMKSLHAKIRVTCKWPAHEWPLCKWVVPEITFQEYVHLIQKTFESKHENK